jgi:transcriptional regulator with XRE-family HTH domain
VDAGVTRAEVARAAGLSASTIGRLEAGRAEPDFETLVRTASALGQEISIKLFPSGRPIHDRYQAPMLEAFLGIVDPRWRRVVEVPVVGVTRGAIDCVLGHPTRPLFVAGELQSQVGRVDAILRHANDKAETLRHSPFVRGAPGARNGSEVEVSQLLVLRSASAVRVAVRDFERTFAAA